MARFNGAYMTETQGDGQAEEYASVGEEERSLKGISAGYICENEYEEMVLKNGGRCTGWARRR